MDEEDDGTTPEPPEADAPAMSEADRDRAFRAAYGTLRRLAAIRKRREAFLTLSPTELVHEAWLKVQRAPDLQVRDAAHLQWIVARTMGQVVIDHARGRRAIKRGGGTPNLPLVDDRIADVVEAHDLILSIDQVLATMAKENPRAAAVADARIRRGLDEATTAAELGISVETVRRDLKFARARIARAIGRPE